MYSADIKQFFDSRAHAALQQDRPRAAPNDFQQGEILHVARAHLHDVGILGDEIGTSLLAHDLGDDGEAGGFAALASNFSPSSSMP